MNEEFVTQYAQAKQALRSGNYSEALSLFEKLWDTAKTPQVAWGYGQSLRKAGRLVEAEAFLREALEQFSDNEWLKKELFWTLYDKEIKPAREQGDLPRLLRSADQMIGLVEDAWAISRLALAIIKVAKQKGKWSVVLSWANRIDPSVLSSAPKSMGKQRGMAEKEIWHLNRSRALYELGKYQEAREAALAGLNDYPQSFFLARIAALALAYSPPQERHAHEALQELENLLEHPRADWYLKADLAQVAMLAGDLQKAQRFIGQALLETKQNPKYMLKGFKTVVELALSIGDPIVAFYHLELIKQVRKREGWKVSGKLQPLEREVIKALTMQDTEKPTLPENFQALLRICRNTWRTWAFIGERRFTGTIKRLKDKFGFIARDDAQEDVFVLIRDLPKRARREGARVEFSIVKSFDKKKNRESTRAVRIVLLQE